MAFTKTALTDFTAIIADPAIWPDPDNYIYGLDKDTLKMKKLDSDGNLTDLFEPVILTPDGRIPFTDGSGILIDSDNLIWDGTYLKVINGTDYVQLYDDGLKVYSQSGAGYFVETYDSTTNISRVYLGRARGTIASPVPVEAGDILGSHIFGGQYGTAFGQMAASAEIQVKAAETFTVSGGAKFGSEYIIKTVATGTSSLTERFHITEDGAIKFNDAYTFPTTNATEANQVLTDTDGNGTLAWTSLSSLTPVSYSVVADLTSTNGTTFEILPQKANTIFVPTEFIAVAVGFDRSSGAPGTIGFDDIQGLNEHQHISSGIFSYLYQLARFDQINFEYNSGDKAIDMSSAAHTLLIMSQSTFPVDKIRFIIIGYEFPKS